MAAPLAIAGAVAGAAYLDARWKGHEDRKLIKAHAKTLVALARMNRNDRNSIYYSFDTARQTKQDDDCYVCDRLTLSYNQVALESNRVAHWLLSLGLQRGDTIAFYMPNKPAFPIVFLACLAIDVIPALINYNLTDSALTHCIKVATPKLVLYESDLASNIAEIAPSFAPGTRLARWVDNFSKPAGEKGVPGEMLVDDALRAAQSGERIPDERRSGLKWTSPACLIYTSGTTGLPKAAVTLHGRSASAFRGWSTVNEFGKKTRIYTPMPLYHSTALLLAVGVAWNVGACVIIGRKFSASTFWNDVRASNANVVQYVGEVLRYLLAVPPSPLDKQHNVKVAYGNGCRPDVWEKFRERFGVPVISEFFASSEGNGSLFNYNTGPFGAGAVGSEGILVGAVQRKKQVVVRVDTLTEEPARGKDGLCIRAADGEAGELVMLIDNASPHQMFAGYHNNKSATEKKIIRDVLKKGDMYFRTGDLLRHESTGHWYFADRLGDTFRWRSENISCQDVAEKLGAVLSEVNVYGVLVPRHDGRAGCAAIPKSAGPLDLPLLSAHVQKALPKYAQPVFLRLVDVFETTGTAKQTKVKLRNEGVDPAVVSDPVYWMHPEKKEYVPFERSDWERLGAGGHKL
ncbi:hypothetical protein JCM10207_002512 [Rhodosporidiobolus poonsookiae]